MEGREYRPFRALYKDWPLLVILGAMIAASIVVYPHLPERVPVHWNAAGGVDRYGSRFTGAFAIPLLTVGIYAGMLLMPLIDPKRANYGRFLTAYRAIRAGLVVFLALLYGATMAVSLGYPINISRVVPFALGLLFILTGNFLTQIRFNYFTGIRTPWTLASEEVCRKTHRFGGFIFVIAGVVTVLAAFLPAPVNFAVAVGSIMAAAVASFVYSAVIYKKLNRG
ncbi:MAG: SdpI family protein [Bacillota bacterium]